jgi:ABC-2 type transport system ATP-binding protein
MGLLEVKNLYKHFDGVTAVDDVSFVVPEGSIFGLIGRNGAGKTTTLRMIMNVFMPDRGEVLFNGSPAGSEFRERTGYLPEERGMYKKLKVLETILFFAELKGKKNAEVQEEAIRYLKEFGLYDRRNSKIQELSKGNQQKVQFISTIIHDPDFIILDEPFSGMDPINTNILRNIILEMKRKGKVIIFSTHLMDFAEKMCDNITLIDKGKVILSGKLHEIKSKFAHRNITVSFEGDISFLKNEPFVEHVEDFGKSISIKVTDNKYVQDVLKSLIEHGVSVQSFLSNEISLHEIFVSLCGNEDAEVENKGVGHEN